MNTIYVYTDGACTKNGTPKARAGIGIYFSKDNPLNVSRKIEGIQTNNVAELTAIITAIKIVINAKINISNNVVIYTDSKYSILSATSYGKKMAAIGWMKNIPNLELVKELYTLYSTTPNILLKHIEAHTGKNDIHSLGNEQADILATSSINSSSKENNKESKSISVNNKIYVDVSFSDKEDFKKNGGKWDVSKKKWYILDSNPNKNTIISKYSKIYLDIDYSNKDKVKNLGGMWDSNEKKWYIYANNPNKQLIMQLSK